MRRDHDRSHERLSIHRVRVSEWQRYREIRLAALRESPEWFGTTWDEAQKRTEESWQKQVRQLATSSCDASFLATRGSELAGILSLYQTAPGEGELMQVWVSPSWRGTGLASRLFRRLVRWAERAGFRRLTVTVKSANARAARLYEKWGFALRSRTEEESTWCWDLEPRP